MTKNNFFKVVLLVIFVGFFTPRANTCTNVLVSAGASADGSVMISYLADAGGFMDPLYFSRCFKKRFGISPIYYHKKFH